MIVTKQTPLQPKEIQLIDVADDVDQVCRQLKLGSRPSIPLEIIRAYESLQNPQDLAVWGQDPRNRALHRLATEANRGSFIGKQSSQWGSQYSATVNLYLLAQPKYRKLELLPQLKPVFHPDLWLAINHWDPQLELSVDYRQQLRQQVIQRYNKAPHQIHKPIIQNPYNLVPLNWVAILELWVCTPQLQHKNQLLSWLGHQPLCPQALFETPNDL